MSDEGQADAAPVAALSPIVSDGSPAFARFVADDADYVGALAYREFRNDCDAEVIIGAEAIDPGYAAIADYRRKAQARLDAASARRAAPQPQAGPAGLEALAAWLREPVGGPLPPASDTPQPVLMSADPVFAERNPPSIVERGGGGLGRIVGIVILLALAVWILRGVVGR